MGTKVDLEIQSRLFVILKKRPVTSARPRLDRKPAHFGPRVMLAPLVQHYASFVLLTRVVTLRKEGIEGCQQEAASH